MINVEGMMETGKITIIIIDSGKNHPQMLKLVGIKLQE